jgi:hypothetical protein
MATTNGSRRLFAMYFATVVWPTSMPSLRCRLPRSPDGRAELPACDPRHEKGAPASPFAASILGCLPFCAHRGQRFGSLPSASVRVRAVYPQDRAWPGLLARQCPLDRRPAPHSIARGCGHRGDAARGPDATASMAPPVPFCERARGTGERRSSADRPATASDPKRMASFDRDTYIKSTGHYIRKELFVGRGSITSSLRPTMTAWADQTMNERAF